MKVNRQYAASALFAIGGAAAATALVRVGVATNPSEHAYVDRAEYATWCGLAVIQTAVWCGAGAHAWYWTIPGHTTERRRRRAGIAAGVGAGIGAVTIAQGQVMDYTFDRLPHALLARLVALGVAIAVSSGVVVERLLATASRARELNVTSAPIAEFGQLWRLQRRALFVLGTFFSLLMVASAGKAAANDSFETYQGSFPRTYLLTIGLFYALVLLALYLPSHLAIRRSGEALADTLAKRDTGNTDTLEYVDRAGKWRTALGIDAGAYAELERGVVLLAPLVSALISTVISS